MDIIGMEIRITWLLVGNKTVNISYGGEKNKNYEDSAVFLKNLQRKKITSGAFVLH